MTGLQSFCNILQFPQVAQHGSCDDILWIQALQGFIPVFKRLLMRWRALSGGILFAIFFSSMTIQGCFTPGIPGVDDRIILGLAPSLSYLAEISRLVLKPF